MKPRSRIRRVAWLVLALGGLALGWMWWDWEPRYDGKPLRVWLRAFHTLGPRAEDAVPELIKLYEQNPPLDSQRHIAWALGGIGPAGRGAIPALERGRASTNWMVASSADMALSMIRNGNFLSGSFHSSATHRHPLD
jgi:hypothetical protein